MKLVRTMHRLVSFLFDKANTECFDIMARKLYNNDYFLDEYTIHKCSRPGHNKLDLTEANKLIEISLDDIDIEILINCIRNGIVDFNGTIKDDSKHKLKDELLYWTDERNGDGIYSLIADDSYLNNYHGVVYRGHYHKREDIEVGKKMQLCQT